MESCHYPFDLPPLPYAVNALEPYIDGKTMQLHHDRHLQTYVDRLNGILRGCPSLQRCSLTQLLQLGGSHSTLPPALKNNAGGVYNHLFFFAGMTPAKEGTNEMPDGALAQAIRQTFGSFSCFESRFKQAALSVFGSGYAWLVCAHRRLAIVTTRNQDCPLSFGQCPLLTVDVWEHAYYLKHYNDRAAYLDDWWQVIDWQRAERLFCS